MAPLLLAPRRCGNSQPRRLRYGIPGYQPAPSATRGRNGTSVRRQCQPCLVPMVTVVPVGESPALPIAKTAKGLDDAVGRETERDRAEGAGKAKYRVTMIDHSGIGHGKETQSRAFEAEE